MDKKGVSPVIGSILLIAVTVIVAGVIAAFAMGLGTPDTAPVAKITLDNIKNGASGFYIYHDGGDTISDAYSVSGDNITWNNLSLSIDGSAVGADNTVTGDSNTNFEVGEKITISLSSNLSTGNRIVLIHVPTDSIIQEATV